MEPFHPRRGLALNLSKGFTLVELMVVLAIIIVIMGVVLSSQNSFNKTLTLANTAYDIALTLRSAEAYGIGTRARIGTGGGIISQNAGYGVHFQTGSAFTLFADTYPASSNLPSSCHPKADSSTPDALPGDCAYEEAQGEKVLDYTLGNGITVSNFCAFNGSWSCASGGLNSLDIVFARPNADPFMSVDGSYNFSSPITKACVTVLSLQGSSRFVSIAASGRIVANAACCDISCP